VAFDTSRLRPGEIVAAAGGILLFVFMFFFKWYGVGGQVGDLAKSFGVDVSFNGWHGHSVLRWLMLLTILAALALAFLTATQRTVALPVTTAVIVTALAALLTVLLAYRVVINEPGPNQFIDVKIGAWLGLLSSALITYGGYRSMREEGTSLSDAAEQARAAGQQARSAFDGAAPQQEEGSSVPPPTVSAPVVSEPPAAAPPPPPPSAPAVSEPPAAAPPPPPPPAPAVSEPPAADSSPFGDEPLANDEPPAPTPGAQAPPAPSYE
jgi:hypothetical protein